jgi:hypothetical protein
VLVPKFSELEGLTDQELKDRFDRTNELGQTFHVPFYLDELRRRQSKRSEDTMRHLTFVIAFLTLVNVAVVVVALFK